MSQTSAAALRTTYCVFQIGSKLARSACGTKRSVRADARWDTAGVASAAVAASTPAPVADCRNALRFMLRTWCVTRALTRARKRQAVFDFPEQPAAVLLNENGACDLRVAGALVDGCRKAGAKFGDRRGEITCREPGGTQSLMCDCQVSL